MAEDPELRIRNDRFNKLRRELEERKRIQKEITWVMPDEPEGDQGIMGEFAHLASLTAEGVAFKAMWVMLFNALEALFAVRYREEVQEYKDAKKHGIAYTQGERGWPPIYPVDEKGNVDFSKSPITDGTAPRDLIRANGYVPKPSKKESYQIQWLRFQKRMEGTSSLSPQDKALLYKSFEGALQKRAESADAAKSLRKDFQAIQQMRGPKPGGR